MGSVRYGSCRKLEDLDDLLIYHVDDDLSDAPHGVLYFTSEDDIGEIEKCQGQNDDALGVPLAPGVVRLCRDGITASAYSYPFRRAGSSYSRTGYSFCDRRWSHFFSGFDFSGSFARKSS